ncbi:Phage integrase family protein [Roseovarius litoreus]|uniref:Phage integrase family protein n=1 Tax=Roseovarius litoreus TaxID=1155722 RepID=A0A1M7LRN4_9RHOB|nr:site-specific integrase [Roseovarius litoreus]SHM80801.1 Phage integrase family protein [Roseovarius litoreus]
MGIALPLQDWPAADQDAFVALFAEGSLLDDRGPLAHWRARSRKLMERQYGRWLDWISQVEPEALALSPVERATYQRLHAWRKSMGDLVPATLFGYVDAVVRLSRLSAPDHDWKAQLALLADLHRAVKQHGSPRKTGRIHSSDVLFEAGAMLVQGNVGPITHPDRAVRLRDGAIICLLALMPMRRRALSELRLGTSLSVENGQITVCLNGSMTKNGQPWEAIVPDTLLEILTIYLQTARPALLARGSTDTDAVWVGRNGTPPGINQFTRAIRKRTKDLLGIDVSPHLFRDAAATTLARTDPASARLIKPILGHASERISEEHYIRTDTIAAGRGLASALANLKKGD